MKIADIVENSIYHCKYGNYDFIFRAGKDGKIHHIAIQSKNYWTTGWIFYKDWSSSEHREATIEEIQWFETCEKAGKYIPKEEIVVDNELIFQLY